MKVTFTDTESFCTEIRESADEIDGDIVRLCVDTNPVNSGTERVFLVSGFTAGGELRELTEDCGNQFCDGSGEGRQRLNAVAEQIRQCCDELDLRVRDGRFEP